jgi:hypothetical protein
VRCFAISHWPQQGKRATLAVHAVLPGAAGEVVLATARARLPHAEAAEFQAGERAGGEVELLFSADIRSGELHPSFTPLLPVLCLLKMPFSLPRLMLRPIVDTLFAR